MRDVADGKGGIQGVAQGSGTVEGGVPICWRRMQSAANPSLAKIPVNREKYREFWARERA